MTDEQAWSLEERLWLEEPGVYDGLLDPECLMAFPGMGVTRASAVLDSLRDAPRWTAVEMTDRALGRAGAAVIVLGYHAVGRRGAAPPHHVFCTHNISNEWICLAARSASADRGRLTGPRLPGRGQMLTSER